MLMCLSNNQPTDFTVRRLLSSVSLTKQNRITEFFEIWTEKQTFSRHFLVENLQNACFFVLIHSCIEFSFRCIYSAVLGLWRHFLVWQHENQIFVWRMCRHTVVGWLRWYHLLFVSMWQLLATILTINSKLNLLVNNRLAPVSQVWLFIHKQFEYVANVAFHKINLQ